jgi:hypothetical protein
MGLLVRAAGWHTGDLGLILGRDSLSIHLDVYPQCSEHSWDGYVHYTKVLISFHFHFKQFNFVIFISAI